MAQWRVETPRTLDLTGVRGLKLRVVAGTVDVVGHTGQHPTADRPATLEIHDVDGPLEITLADDGTLTISHERLTWGGLLGWIGPRKARADLSLSLPADCPVELGVVSADATLSGLAGPHTSIKSVSGDVTLDGVRSDIRAQTVSGNLLARNLDGPVQFTTVSGDLTLAGGQGRSVRAETVSGDLMLDLDLLPHGSIDINSVSGDLTLRLPGDAALEVDAKSLSGLLQCAFPGVTLERRPGTSKLHGRIGATDAAGRLKAKSVSGDVVLLQRNGADHG